MCIAHVCRAVNATRHAHMDIVAQSVVPPAQHRVCPVGPKIPAESANVNRNYTVVMTRADVGLENLVPVHRHLTVVMQSVKRIHLVALHANPETCNGGQNEVFCNFYH